MKVRKAVIPAAGLGTRFLPATKAVPKELLPIVDTPALQIVVEEAVRSGIRDIVLVSGRHKSAIEEHFDRAVELEHTLAARGKQDELGQLEAISKMANVISVRQKAPNGLGHAVACARHVIGDEPFAVLLPDDLFVNDERPGISQLCAVYEETGACAIGTMEVAPGQEHLYGIVEGTMDASSRRMRVKSMVEKPAAGTAPSRHAVIGRYVLPPSIWEILERTQPGKGGEIQLTDALCALCSIEPGVYALALEGERHDVGDRLGFLRANLAFALRRDDLRGDVLRMARALLDQAG